MATREELIQKRKALTAEEIQTLSVATTRKFLSVAPFLQSGPPKHIALYRSMPREIDLRPLESELRAARHSLYFPRVQSRNEKGLEFVCVGPNDQFQTGPYNIQEPHSELKATDPKQLDIILVPGVGFGANGERIGMGAGYYDRFLPSVPEALRIALAFDFQLLPRLDQNPWDQPVHWIVTEVRSIEAPAATQWLESRGYRRKA